MSLISPSPNPVEAAFVPIQYYTNTDLYNYQVDNRPLQDIATNQTVLATGIDQNSLAIHSLTQNAQQGTLNYGADSGAANAYVVTLTPAPTAYSAGMVVNVGTISASNTGASTVNVNGLGVLPIVGPGGAALQGGEIVAGSNISLQINPALSAAGLIYTGGAFPVAAGTKSGQAVNFGQLLLSSRKAEFTSNGTFTVPPGVTTIFVTAVGGGGGGGGGNQLASSTQGGGGGGGFAGNYVIKQDLSVSPADSLSISIGAGGAGGAGTTTLASASNGVAGGATTITDTSTSTPLLTLAGGLSGSGATLYNTNYVYGGSGANPGIAAAGISASGTVSGVVGIGGAGQNSIFAPAGPGAPDGGSNGVSGSFGSGGGGGGGFGNNGGNGGNGYVLIEW